MSTTIGNVTYTFNSGTGITIASGFTGTPTSITILSSVTIGGSTRSVTQIGTNAFNSCTTLSLVTIQNGVITISANAFQNCTSLTSITIPNSVTFMAQAIFSNCTSLTSITLPNDIPSIGQSVFNSCTSLTSVTIQNKVITIGPSAFNNCTNLPSITIPNSVTNLGANAFRSCTNLSSVTLSSALIDINNNVFQSCTSLTSITIPNTTTNIGLTAFSGCTNLKSVTIINPFKISTSIDAFTDVSSDPSSNITFYNTPIPSNLNSTWQTIANYYANKTYYPISPTITNFSIPIKVYGDNPFQITQPSSNSSGSFSYTSSNLSVATILGDIITIVGVGSSTITATQAASGNYTSGTITAPFQVNQSTPDNPVEISNSNNLIYFMGTTSTYANIINSIEINQGLSSLTEKTITVSNNNINIIKNLNI